MRPEEYYFILTELERLRRSNRNLKIALCVTLLHLFILIPLLPYK